MNRSRGGVGGFLGASKAKNEDTPAADEETELKDYKSEASSLFGNIRVPAALFAGASAGAAFAMPVAAAGEGLK